MAKKIALFGGSFDPVHTDHVNIIKACKEKLNFDEVWVIPAYVNPFKHLSTSSVTQRLDMLLLALKDLEYAKVDEYEISKTEASFTYNTVSHFKETYPEYDFSFIMGSDQLDMLETWDHFNELIKIIDFKVFIRTDTINQDIVSKYNLETFKFDNNRLSSTDIRNLVNLNLQIPAVNEYINNNLMYLHERLEQHMDEKRYIHSINVGKTALELAKLNNIDLNKALIAGTLHDITKRWSEDKMKSYLLKYDKELIKEPLPVWHSYVGAMHLKHDWLFKDDEIIDAVFHHTVAKPAMSTLEMIVFCADKISEERNYENVEKYRTLVKSDLKLGFLELLKNHYKVAILKHSRDNIGNRIIDAYQYYFEE